MTQFEKTYKVMKNPITIVMFVILIVLSFLFIDRPVATYFHDLDLRTNMHWLYFITAFGEWKYYAIIFFIAALYFRRRHEQRKRSPMEHGKSLKIFWMCIFMLGVVLGTTLLNFVLKVSLGRARPELFFSSGQYGFYWFKLKDAYWSMPSGHTTTISALAAGLGVLFPRYFWLFLVAVVLVAASRVLLHYHYVSDVLVSFYIATLCIGLISSFDSINSKL